MKFVIRPAAGKDILRQYEYYLIEKDADQAAARFLLAVEATISQVCQNPGIGAPKILSNPNAVVAGEGVFGDSRVLSGLKRRGSRGASPAWQEGHQVDSGRRLGFGTHRSHDQDSGS